MKRFLYILPAFVTGLWLISSGHGQAPASPAGRLAFRVGVAAKNLGEANATIGPLQEIRVYERTTLPASYADTRCDELRAECVLSYKRPMSYSAIFAFVKTLPETSHTILVFHHEPECGGKGPGGEDMPPATFLRESEQQSSYIRYAAKKVLKHPDDVRVAMVACTYSYQEPYDPTKSGHDGAYPTCAFIPPPSYVNFYLADIYNFKPGDGNVAVNPSTRAKWDGWLKCVKGKGRGLGVAEYGLAVPASTAAQRVRQLKADESYFKTFDPGGFVVWSYFYEGSKWTFTDPPTIREWKAIEAAAEPTVHAMLGARSNLTKGYYGVNYAYDNVALYPGSTSRLLSQLKALDPGTLRWPGGTGANYFQWQLGHNVAPPKHKMPPGSCKAPQIANAMGFRFWVSRLAAAYRATGATPIFDLNVMTPKSVHNQIELLKTAHDRYDIPIDYVELGNELYLCNADYVYYFPTATVYGRTVAKFVAAVHGAFPNARIAAVGAIGTHTARDRTWNSDMLSAARAAGHAPNAITYHEYPKYDLALTNSRLPALFELPYTHAAALNQVASKVKLPAWITEYNMDFKSPAADKHPAQSTFARALFLAEMDLLSPRVSYSTRADMYSSFQRGPGYAYDGTTLTPVGVATEYVDRAAVCSRGTAAISFPNGPVLGSSGYPALMGQAFFGRKTQRDVLLNLTGKRVTVPSGEAIPEGLPYREVFGAPVKDTTAASALRSSSGTVNGRLRLAPYSITLAGAPC